jgi:UDP-glucose 4-epimerase
MVLNRIGLTGATGMLGRHLHTALAQAGAQVVAFSRQGDPSSTISDWDLENWKTLDELDGIFSGVQAIVHAGAMVPRQSMPVDEARMFDANVRACLNLGLWAIARNVPVVHVSGAIVYAEHVGLGQTANAPLGWSGFGGFYGLSKLLAEDAFHRLRPQGLKLAVIRASSIYGYGLSADKMLSRFLATAGADHTIELAQPVQDRIDLVHAADVSRAIVAILAADAWDVFNVGSGRPVSIRELAEACVSAVGCGRVKITESDPLGHVPVTRFELNCSRASDRLGWRPTVDLACGLKMMVEERISLDRQTNVASRPGEAR